MRVAIEAHVAEALRDVGDKGLHVTELAKYSNINPDKLGMSRFSACICIFLSLIIPLARVLRLLATHHIFKEVSPNVFAHSRMSLPLDTGKDAAAFAKTEYISYYVRGG